MSDLADALKNPGPTRNDPRPNGWQPRYELDSDTGGYVVSKPYEPEASPEHDAVLDEFGLDPAQWSVTSVRRSRWQTYHGDWLESVRLNVVPASAARSARVDMDRLCDEIARWRPRTTKKVSRSGTYVQPVGDTQFGKIDGDGTPGTVARLLRETEASAQRLRADVGRGQAEHAALPWLGDCIEGVWSQGGALRMRLDLTPTEQVRVYRRCLWAQVKVFAHLAERLTVPVVPGNHDEALRVGDKMATVYDDSWAIEGASAVYDQILENDDLAGRVEFVFPEPDELTITLNISGTSVGMAHGHQFGSNPLKWWDEQAGGRTLIGNADLLLGAHKHNFVCRDHGGGRMFIQIPALDGGSNWFRHRRGQSSPSRLVSFWTADGEIWGLDPLKVAR